MLNSSIAVFMADRKQVTTRPIIRMIENEESMIEIDRNSENVQVSYAVYFRMKIEDPNFKLSSCSVYPTEEFESIQECDNKFVESVFRQQGLNPFWIPDPLTNITRYKYIENGKTIALPVLANTVYGVTTSDCKIPCTTVSVTYK